MSYSNCFGMFNSALEEDAQAAIAKFQNHSFQGRNIKLELGLKKENDPKKRKRERESLATQDSSVTAVKEADAKPKATLKIPSKPEAAVKSKEIVASEETEQESINRGRQVIVFGIPIDVNKRIFSRVLDKIVRKVSVEFITEDHSLSSSLLITYPAGKIVLLTANSRPDAQKIVERINADTIGSLGFGKFNFAEVSKKSEADDEADSDENAATEAFKTKNMLKQRLIARVHSEVAPVTHRKKKCRLIIRNLSFQAREEHILEKMKRFGPIVDIDLPIQVIEKPAKKRSKQGETSDADVNSTVRKIETHRGFAFITFLCEKDARAAVEQSAGEGKTPLKVCNREVAVDFCHSKDSYLKFGAAGSEEGETTEPTTTEQKEEANKTEAMEVEEDEENDNENDEDEEGDGSGDDEENDDFSDDDDDLEEDDGDSLEEDNGDSDDDEDEKSANVVDKDEYVSNAKNQKLIGGDVNEGRTLFLRNLAYDTKADDIKKALGRFGHIELALVVMDRATGMSKGSAFVKFADGSSVDRCLKECESTGIEINHKVVKINRAIDRDSAEKIKQGHRPGKDKRNLFLANEGLALDSSNANMNEYDREKRMRAQTDKKKKLQNPLFFVSHERLSLRNLSKYMKDHELRVMCLKATKAGMSKGLVTLEDMQNLQQAQGPELFENGVEGSSSSSSSTSSNGSTVALRSFNSYKLDDLRELPKFDGKKCVKSAKIMLDLDRAKKDNGAASGAPSRGYGFVEFTHHAYALACLRELNNNAAYEQHAQQTAVRNGVGKGKDGDKQARTRLIVDFSLENIKKVKVLKDRQARAQSRKLQQQAAAGGNIATTDEQKKKSKRRNNTQRKPKQAGLPAAVSTTTDVVSSDAAVESSQPEKVKESKKRGREETEETAVSPDKKVRFQNSAQANAAGANKKAFVKRDKSLKGKK